MGYPSRRSGEEAVAKRLRTLRGDAVEEAEEGYCPQGGQDKGMSASMTVDHHIPYVPCLVQYMRL